MSLKNGETGFLEEKPGVKSSMRLMSFMVYWLLVGIDYLLLQQGYYKTAAFDMWFTVFFISVNLIFLIAMFYPKYLQKIIELGASKIGTFKNALAPISATQMNPDAQTKQVAEVKQTTEVNQ